MEIPSPQSLNLCYCYAYEDRKDAQKLDDHLTALKMSRVIQACYGCAFSLDGPWEQEVAAHINTAHIVLLLISAQFLRSSEKWYRREIAFALERHGRREAWVIPLFLSDVVLEGTYLSELRMLPNNDQFISRVRDKAHAYADIAREILRVAREMGDTLAQQTEQFQDEPLPLATSPSDLSPSPDRQAGFVSISWSPQTTWLAAGATDGAIDFYNVNDYDERYLLPSHTRDVYSVAWSDNLLASSSADGTVRLWNTRQQSLIHTLQGHTQSVNSVAWSPGGKKVISGSADKTLRLWDTGNGSILRVLTGHTQSVMSVTWSPDGKLLASGSLDRRVLLWDARSGRELRAFQHQAEVMSVAWSLDSLFLATGVGNAVQLWQVSTGKTLHTLQGHTSTVTAVAWSPDGRFLASSSRDQTVSLWDPLSGRRLRTLQGHMQGLTGLAWPPDGKSLAAVSHDELSLWNTETGELIATLDNQRVLRTILHQTEKTLRVNMIQYNDEDSEEFPRQEVESGEFLQHERTIQKQATLQEKLTLICPYCYKPFPEKSVHNRRKRSLREIVCDACQTSVSLSLLTSQEQSGDNIVSDLAQAARGESPQQIMQATLRRKISVEAFDVFFCYNHQDKRVVGPIGEQLKRHEILPWLEEWDLRPGEPWQRALEEQIRKAPTAIIFVGSHGMGPWQDSEMYAILRQMKKRGCRVIPVLLPGTLENIELSVFLEEMRPIDFRVHDPDPIQQLVWGITGKK